MQNGTLYFFCGKMGAGKSTESKVIASNENAVLISEDEWLSILYPKLINSFDDYIHYSSLLKPLIFEHVINLLNSGTNVVLDFAANTPKQRKWFVDITNSAGASAQLIYLKVSNEHCLKRIAKRRIEQPDRAAFDTEAVFNEVNKFFQEPDEIEGTKIQIRVIASE